MSLYGQRTLQAPGPLAELPIGAPHGARHSRGSAGASPSRRVCSALHTDGLRQWEGEPPVCDDMPENNLMRAVELRKSRNTRKEDDGVRRITEIFPLFVAMFAYFVVKARGQIKEKDWGER